MMTLHEEEEDDDDDDNNNDNRSAIARTMTTTPTTTSTTSTTSMTMMMNVWNGKDVDVFHSLSHPGYSMESDPITGTGGWHAHRATLQALDGVLPADWIRDEVAGMITKFDYSIMPMGRAPRVLVLYGSLRDTSYSRKLAYEYARLLDMLGCDVRVYNPIGLPVRDPTLEDHIKVQELRGLTFWSDGHVWVSPEMHGNYTGCFKNQMDWIPLNTDLNKPTQGKTCCIAQVNGGGLSSNAVNALRLLARWMRMVCCTNQCAIPRAWEEFDERGRMMPSSYRERVVDAAEEFAKFTAIVAPVADQLNDRYSERKAKLREKRRQQQQQHQRVVLNEPVE